MKSRFLILVLFSLTFLYGCDDRKPPMGWNSFDSYGVYFNESAAFDNIGAMKEKLLPSGYRYFVIDNGWFGEYKLEEGTIYSLEKHASDVNINEYGLVQPSVTYFPHGFEQISEKDGV